MIIVAIISFVIVQRLVEVFVAKRNEKKMKVLGAFEVGQSHYPFMLALHISFFISLIGEILIFNRQLSPLFIWLFILFLLTQGLRIWCLTSLGQYWNTKIIILPGANVVKKGPYLFFRHPNYLVVCIEILVLPLMFQAYFTAICFTLLNFAMLSVRIPLEEQALMEVTNYKEKFKKNIPTHVAKDNHN